MQIDKPNIFLWAPSELSQDAFICWLLSWANYKEIDPILYSVSIHFINEMVDNRLPKIEKVEVIKQYNSIDILCKINDEFVLLIEDKVHSKNHSDQLNRYYKILCSEFLPDKIFPVYLKTGDQSDFAEISKAGYKIFLRKHFLSVLDYGISIGVTSDVFLDFYKHITGIELSVLSYKRLPVNQWHWDSWKGFYTELKERLGDGNWDYVNQKNGGFIGFWWKWRYKEFEDVGFDYYLQLEFGKFCFKLYPYERDKAEDIRAYYRKLLYEKAKEHNISIYQNGRIGETMTVAALVEPYLKIDANGYIDFDQTILLLKKIETMLLEL